MRKRENYYRKSIHLLNISANICSHRPNMHTEGSNFKNCCANRVNEFNKQVCEVIFFSYKMRFFIRTTGTTERSVCTRAAKATKPCGKPICCDVTIHMPCICPMYASARRQGLIFML